MSEKHLSVPVNAGHRPKLSGQRNPEPHYTNAYERGLADGSRGIAPAFAEGEPPFITTQREAAKQGIAVALHDRAREAGPLLDTYEQLGVKIVRGIGRIRQLLTRRTKLEEDIEGLPYAFHGPGVGTLQYWIALAAFGIFDMVLTYLALSWLPAPDWAIWLITLGVGAGVVWLGHYLGIVVHWLGWNREGKTSTAPNVRTLIIFGGSIAVALIALCIGLNVIRTEEVVSPLGGQPISRSGAFVSFLALQAGIATLSALLTFMRLHGAKRRQALADLDEANQELKAAQKAIDRHLTERAALRSRVATIDEQVAIRGSGIVQHWLICASRYHEGLVQVDPHRQIDELQYGRHLWGELTDQIKPRQLDQEPEHQVRRFVEELTGQGRSNNDGSSNGASATFEPEFLFGGAQ